MATLKDGSTKVLLTGGTGYIGSHTAVTLLEAGHDVVLVDNLSNSKPVVVDRLEAITGRRPVFHEGDLTDKAFISEVMQNEAPDAVVHFAGLKAVGESVEEPLRYYETNLVSTFNLCNAMIDAAVHQLVFSSSATVYGIPEQVPMREDDSITTATNPYGSTKLYIEQILTDLAHARPEMRIALLRYFNPAGAHESGTIGEDPNGIPNNLLPYITQVAVGRRQELTVNGDDYPTPDGTCIRDYIHVTDLAEGHSAALSHLAEHAGLHTYNLGTGNGSSVLEVVRAFERATNMHIPYQVGPRRAGDIDASFTDPAKAARELGWTAEKDLLDICRDAWRWQQQNPQGYEDD